LEVAVRKQCAVCPAEFEAKRNTAKYCSKRCSVRASRQRGGVTTAIPAPASDGGLEAATLAELGLARREGTAGGLAALALARRIDASDGETGAGLASLVREHRAALADAVRDAAGKPRLTDELKARRDSKLAG
jgi:hypothetical protein